MLNRIPLGGRLFLLGALVSGLVVAAMVRPVAAAPDEANEQWKFAEPARSTTSARAGSTAARPTSCRKAP